MTIEENQGSCCTRFLHKNGLLLATLLGVAVGLAAGIGLRSAKLEHDTIQLIAFPGEILMNMFKMIVIPLIVVSLICGMGNINPSQLGRLGGLSMAYYSVTTFLAVVLGIILVLSIHPGNPQLRVDDIEASEMATIEKNKDAKLSDTILDLIRNFFTDNLFASTVQSTRTMYETINRTKNVGNASFPQYEYELVKTKKLGKVPGMNIIGLIVIALISGAILGRLGEEGKPLLKALNSTDMVISRIVILIIWFSPIGVLFLITEKVLLVADLAAVGKMLAMYIVTVILGLIIHSIFLLLLYFFVTRKSPLKFLKEFAPAMATAFGTSSSSAALPVSFKCLEDGLHISKHICQLVLPIGATINMNGTALYEAVASLFIAQMNGANLSIGEVIIVSVTATLASVGAAAIPSAGLVTMILVLTAINQPVRDISLIISVDWILDRCRTVVNIYGDAICACLVDHLDKKWFTRVEDESSASYANENHPRICKSLPKLDIAGAETNGTTPSTDVTAPIPEAHVVNRTQESDEKTQNSAEQA